MNYNGMFCIIALVCAALGFATRIGKSDFVITSFFRDFAKNPDVYNVELLRAFIAKVLYACAVSYAIMALGTMIGQKYVMWAGIVIFCAIMFYAANYTKDKDHFVDDPYSMRKSQRPGYKGDRNPRP